MKLLDRLSSPGRWRCPRLLAGAAVALLLGNIVFGKGDTSRLRESELFEPGSIRRKGSRLAEAAVPEGPLQETSSPGREEQAPDQPLRPEAEEPILNEKVTELVRVLEHDAFTTYLFTSDLRNTRIFDIAVGDPWVWIATDRGVIGHDPEEGSFHFFGANTGIPGTYVSEIAVVGGRLALDLGQPGYPNSVLGLGTFFFDPTKKTWELLRLGGGSDLMWDGERLWRGNGGAEAIDLATGQAQRFTPDQSGILHSSLSSFERFGDSIFFTMHGDYIQETKDFEGGGVSRLNLSTGEWRSYQRADGLASDYCLALSVDAEAVWVVHGSGKPVSRLDRLRDRWTPLARSKNWIYLGGRGIESDQERVWMMGSGLIELDKKTLQARIYRETDGLPGDTVSAMALGRDFLWVGVYSFSHRDRVARSSGLVRLPRR